MTAPHPEALAELAALLPSGVLASAPEALEKYRYDGSQELAAELPAACVRAESVDDVVATLRWASAHGVAVVPRGAGTGLSGGASGRREAITLTTERMRAIDIDASTRTARVEAGALNAEVKGAAAEHGLWYPPDPSSFETCSIGGNIATNAGGLC